MNRPQDTILAEDAVFRRNSLFVINHHLVAVLIFENDIFRVVSRNSGQSDQSRLFLRLQSRQPVPPIVIAQIYVRSGTCSATTNSFGVAHSLRALSRLTVLFCPILPQRLIKFMFSGTNTMHRR